MTNDKKSKVRFLKSIAEQEGFQFMVAFECNHIEEPQVYILKGKQHDFAIKAMRRKFQQDTKCHYYDTRVVPYSTFFERERMWLQDRPLKIHDSVPVFNSEDYTKVHTLEKKERAAAEFLRKNPPLNF